MQSVVTERVMHTVRSGINVVLCINVTIGRFDKNNKCTTLKIVWPLRLECRENYYQMYKDCPFYLLLLIMKIYMQESIFTVAICKIWNKNIKSYRVLQPSDDNLFEISIEQFSPISPRLFSNWIPLGGVRHVSHPVELHTEIFLH